MLSIFISYSRNDKEFVERLTSRLRSQGLSVWIDEKQIKVGQKISHRIKEGILESDYFLIVISRTSLKSNWVREELDSALYEAISNKPDTILPVLLDDISIPKELQNLKYADFRKGFEQGFQELMRVFQIDEDYLKLLPQSEKKKLIQTLLNTTDKWGETPGEIVTLVEDESYLPIFEENLELNQKKQIIYNSVDAIKLLADYSYDHRIIRSHSSISPLISLYKESNDPKLKEKIIDALAAIGSKLCYDFFITILNEEENLVLKVAVLTGLWVMSSSGDFSDWNPTLLKVLHEYTNWPVEKCLYFDYEKEESDFRFWVFRCIAEAKNRLSLQHVDRFLESHNWPLSTLAEAAAAHWHITKTTKYIDILRQAESQGVSSSAWVTLEKINKEQTTDQRK